MRASLWNDARRPAGRLLQVTSMNGAGNLVAAVQAARGVPAFLRDMAIYGLKSDGSFPLNLGGLLPALGDRYATAGSLGHYFYQDLWAARRIRSVGPSRHVDIGSRIDGFIGHLLVFMPVTVIDVRPFPQPVDGLTFIHEDATTLESIATGGVESLSSLHAVEHFGLGRYGDPVDPGAAFKVMHAMIRVLKPGGHLYFSVPVGRERLEFN